METAHLSAPHRWLGPLSGDLDRHLRDAVVEGVLSGRGWLSLRLDGRFLWLVAQPSLRAIWLDETGIPRSLAETLGRHRRSPFQPLVKGKRVASVACVVDGKGQPAGLLLHFREGEALGVRLWPRPGVLWIQDRAGRVVGSSPPTERVDPPEVIQPPAVEPFDAGTHARICRKEFEDLLRRSLRRRLRDVLSARAKKAARLVEALTTERDEAERNAALRPAADLLAARLHTIQPGTPKVELTGFDGTPVVIELDASLAPAENLRRLYRRAARGERALEALAARLEEASRRRDVAQAAVSDLERLSGIDELLEAARREGIELRPSAPREARGRRNARQPRLPYRIFVLASGREVWIGRSARDNDELTLHRAAPKDLWLHAGGVEGSHVILRREDAPPAMWEIEAAARLAARNCRARHSTTVAVWVTERRYVRKPRKSPPGVVHPERVRTIFVDPHREVEGQWRKAKDELS